MNLSKKIFFFLLFALVSFCGFSQNERKLVKEAEKAYEDGYKKAALDFYLRAYEINPSNPDVNLSIGKIYLETTHRGKSLPYMEKAYAANPHYSHILYLLARSYHYNNKFDKAIEFYQKARTKTKDEAALADIDRKIYECNNGKEFVQNPVEVKIVNMGSNINTPFPEYAPIVSADESVLIFTSRRKGSTGGDLDLAGLYYEDIYISEKVNGTWTAPRSISASINTKSHDASIGLSPDGKELFIYKDTGGGDIYSCKMKKDGTWSKPSALDINDKNTYENAATITPDGNRLFFTSNREGSIGDLDIWVVDKQKNGKWGTPKNLGSAVNTEGAEEAPFLDLDGRTLYFASNRHKGMGDFDIFKTHYDSTSKTWSEPENLGYPINSADEDLYFTLSGDGRHAYFASAKEDGQGDKDLYLITMPPREDYEELVTKVEAISGKTIVHEKVDKLKKEPEPKKEIVLKPVIIKGKVIEISTGKALEAAIEITDGVDKVVYTTQSSSDGTFSFSVSAKEAAAFKITAEKNDYGFSSVKTSTPAPGTEEKVVLVELKLKKLEVGNTFVLRNIYFDFDKAIIKPESNPELTKLLNMLKNNPKLRIEIGGHTDFIGSASYNKSLSQRRANAVVKYLTNNGIAKSRLSAKGYGEERPLASNDDEKEGRELNRRTEFEVKGK